MLSDFNAVLIIQVLKDDNAVSRKGSCIENDRNADRSVTIIFIDLQFGLYSNVFSVFVFPVSLATACLIYHICLSLSRGFLTFFVGSLKQEQEPTSCLAFLSATGM